MRVVCSENVGRQGLAWLDKQKKSFILSIDSACCYDFYHTVTVFSVNVIFIYKQWNVASFSQSRDACCKNDMQHNVYFHFRSLYRQCFHTPLSELIISLILSIKLCTSQKMKSITEIQVHHSHPYFRALVVSAWWTELQPFPWRSFTVATGRRSVGIVITVGLRYDPLAWGCGFQRE